MGRAVEWVGLVVGAVMVVCGVVPLPRAWRRQQSPRVFFLFCGLITVANEAKDLELSPPICVGTLLAALVVEAVVIGTRVVRRRRQHRADRPT
jgi:hypothetical protein